MPTQAKFEQRLRRYYGLYAAGFALFLLVLTEFENLGMRRQWIGYTFLLVTIGVYAFIGLLSRTANITEYFVAGRRVPALYNGMATAADWMSAATFIGMAGSLYVHGFDGLAYITGWTGGFVLVALFLAPYLRRFGQFTIPDFLGARYGGSFCRSIGALAAIVASFVYVVAQIYGVGLITSRFTGVEFGVGVFLGLASILVCSYLGGMRAVTWTQVAQYIILIAAYLIPVMMLSIKHTGSPVPQLTYGYVLEKVTDRERELAADHREREVREIFLQRAEHFDALIRGLPGSYLVEKSRLDHELARLKNAETAIAEVRMAQRAVLDFPRHPDEAIAKWTTAKDAAQARGAPLRPHATPFYGETGEARDIARRNFLALVFCLMLGTAALPHILVRSYTTPGVREARASVGWSLLFIFLLYITAPALAVLVKYDIYTLIVGSHFADLRAWVASWSKVDPGMLSIVDVNRDGVVQLAEIAIDQDIVVLATPEIAGLPYVISGLVAAGGLAAALSTADGLLLTISSALSHDIYYKVLDPNASVQRRVTMSKIAVLLVALIAAWAASLRPGDILFLVGTAFSIAASAFFPALVVGVFWKRANKWGAASGMLAGLLVCIYYMVTTSPVLTRVTGFAGAKWFGIEPISSAIFGVPVGFAVIVVVSLLTAPPGKESDVLLDDIRFPGASS